MNDLALVEMSGARLPSTYSAAKRAISQCLKIDECKDWADKAVALASYAKQAQDEQLEKMAKRIRARALRRYGELSEQIEAAHRNQHSQGCGAATLQTRSASDAAAGMSKDQATRARAIARIPEDEFDKQVDGDDPPPVHELAKQGRKPPAAAVVDRKDLTALVSALKTYAAKLKKIDLESALSQASGSELIQIHTIVSELDGIHDQIATG